MAKKKPLTENDIISYYMDYVLEHNENPKSVYAFAKENKFEEAVFYDFFGGFEAIEAHVFKAFFDNTINVLNKSEDYLSFDARNKLLSFYFTFFEVLTANRSYVIYALHQHKNKLKNLRVLSGLKKDFGNYIRNLEIETIDLKKEDLEKIQNRAMEESAWVQLLLTLKFWIDDTSAKFEKTDIFIEKSVNTSFDVMDVAPIKSILDFGKFLYKENFQMN
ncbi:MAG TPA: TetR family transcriptional regulator C-terminal domain-containing protein [Flavobacteriaceae bacterium]|nr:TetR family transcriptional regulator C-terminal domain-containing protein [Flavobacteriaceae bacterium]